MPAHQKEKIPAILKVEPLEEYRLRVTLGSKSVLQLDMAGRLDTIRFCPLADPAVFSSVTTDGKKLYFGSALEITAAEVMELAMTPPPNTEASVKEHD